jgi:hypothetical protein
VKSINTLKKKKAVALEMPPVLSKEEILLAEIRDILKTGRSYNPVARSNLGCSIALAVKRRNPNGN